MSISGRRAQQGFEYQLRVATNWVIQLLYDADIEYVQVEVIATLDNSSSVFIDDIVISFTDGTKKFVQVKKNSPDYRAWSLSDAVLKKELRKARDQLEEDEKFIVEFCSSSPFGELKKLADNCRTIFQVYSAFHGQAPPNLKKILKKVAEIMECVEQDAFCLLKRLYFCSPRSFEEWDQENLRLLESKVTRPDTGLSIIEALIRNHQTGLRAPKIKLTKFDIQKELEEHGLIIAPKYEEHVILSEFKKTSQIGRHQKCCIEGEYIPRSELDTILTHIESGVKSILVTDMPGGGKTCLLLQMADTIEKNPSLGLLFIKGDYFSEAQSEDDFIKKGIPENLTAKVARLAEYRKVVVIVDSLDVLALYREHKVLDILLSYIDQLIGIENVTVVAACRTFDLDYHPKLRDRHWDKKIALEKLDYDRNVTPLLKKWNVNDATFSKDLKELLCVPQNLYLFSRLKNRINPKAIHTSFDLYEHFIEEIIIKDEKLGNSAISILNHLANELVRSRKTQIHKLSLKAEDTVLERLFSQEILREENGRIAFQHQTLLDALMVRNALSKHQTFSDFIKSFLPVPFIRPFVRAFFYYLRMRLPEEFSKQIWGVIENEKIAYHLRRLVVESLAEIEPEDEDWPLIRRLFRQHAALFRRFLGRIESGKWFRFITNKWLPIIKDHTESEKWLYEFANKLKTWMNEYPSEVISLWIDILRPCSNDAPSLASVISMNLHDFRRWETEGVETLLSELLKFSDRERDIFLGQAISRYVEATNKGDGLLWDFIIQPLGSNNNRWELEKKLRCDEHQFHEKDFFEKRVKESEWLLDKCLDAIEFWSRQEVERTYSKKGLRNVFLEYTSWRETHSEGELYRGRSFTILFKALEAAVLDHAKKNDSWWKANEPRLRKSKELGIRYIVILAYQENIQENQQGIGELLTDVELFKASRLNYELGRLMNVAYPILSNEIQIKNQKIILSLCSEEEADKNTASWYEPYIFNYLKWIPPLFRIPASQNFLNKFQSQLDTTKPVPDIFSRGGTVASPVSPEKLLSLSKESMIRLLKHYENDDGWNETINGVLVGGKEALRGALVESASRCPEYYVFLLPHLISESIDFYFTISILEGIARHIEYLYGNVNPPHDWKPKEPLPDRMQIVATLLSYAEKPCFIRRDSLAYAWILKACSLVLESPDYIERISFLLLQKAWQCFLFDDNSSERDRENDLIFRSINSSGGIAAEAAILLTNRLLKKGSNLPDFLLFALKYFAKNPDPAIRVAILRHLPFTIYKKQELGWMLFDIIFSEPQKELWKHAYNCLYYNYHNEFGRVSFYLKRILEDAPNEAGEKWAKLSTLAYLSGYLSKDELFQPLVEKNKATFWNGAIKVFAANLNNPQYNQICYDGLVTSLKDSLTSCQLIDSSIETRLFQKENYPFITEELFEIFISRIDKIERGNHLFHIFEWISEISKYKLGMAFDCLERLTDVIEEQENRFRLTHTEPIIVVLSTALKEADEFDDVDFLKRIMRLYDRLLKLEIYNVEKVFNE